MRQSKKKQIFPWTVPMVITLITGVLMTGLLVYAGFVGPDFFLKVLMALMEGAAKIGAALRQ